MGWLLRLPIYLLIVGGLVVLTGCYMAPWMPWAPACHAIFGPPPSDPMQMQIVPPWYALPLYGALRSATFDVGPLDAKTIGLVLVVLVLLAPLSLVFTNWSRTKARAWISVVLAFIAFVALGWVGAQPPIETPTTIGLALVALYLSIMLVAFPLLARRAR
jgi:quinol-cytochrome oxidoreductase complex cytochrome b subunit